MHNIIIIFLTKASSRNARSECGNNWSCYCFLFEKKIVNVLYSVTYSPSDRQVGAAIINILSTIYACGSVHLVLKLGMVTN
jgi:hypothetical protein